MSDEAPRRFCRLADSPRIHSLTEILARRLGKDLYECDAKGNLITPKVQEVPPEPAPVAQTESAPKKGVKKGQ